MCQIFLCGWIVFSILYLGEKVVFRRHVDFSIDLEDEGERPDVGCLTARITCIVLQAVKQPTSGHSPLPPRSTRKINTTSGNNNLLTRIQDNQLNPTTIKKVQH